MLLAFKYMNVNFQLVGGGKSLYHLFRFQENR